MIHERSQLASEIIIEIGHTNCNVQTHANSMSQNAYFPQAQNLTVFSAVIAYLAGRLQTKASLGAHTGRFPNRLEEPI